MKKETPYRPRLDIPDRTVLIPGDLVDRRIAELGPMVSEYIEASTRPVVYAVVKKGGADFGMQLRRHICPNYHLGFIRTGRYSGSQTGGQVTLRSNELDNVRGCNVVIADDIADERWTLDYLARFLTIMEGAAEVKIVTMLNKHEKQQAAIKVDWTGFNIPKVFVWGRGLDGGDDSEEKRNDFDICFSGPHPGGPDYAVPSHFPV